MHFTWQGEDMIEFLSRDWVRCLNPIRVFKNVFMQFFQMVDLVPYLCIFYSYTLAHADRSKYPHTHRHTDTTTQTHTTHTRPTHTRSLPYSIHTNYKYIRIIVDKISAFTLKA